LARCRGSQHAILEVALGDGLLITRYENLSDHVVTATHFFGRVLREGRSNFTHFFFRNFSWCYFAAKKELSETPENTDIRQAQNFFTHKTSFRLLRVFTRLRKFDRTKYIPTEVEIWRLVNLFWSFLQIVTYRKLSSLFSVSVNSLCAEDGSFGNI
jgi:hypothetical protein